MHQKQNDAASSLRGRARSGEWAPSCDGCSTTPCCDGCGDRCSQISQSLAPVPLPGDVAPPIPRADSGVSNHSTRGTGRALSDHSLLPGLAGEGALNASLIRLITGLTVSPLTCVPKVSVSNRLSNIFTHETVRGFRSEPSVFSSV